MPGRKKARTNSSSQQTHNAQAQPQVQPQAQPPVQPSIHPQEPLSQQVREAQAHAAAADILNYIQHTDLFKFT
jgi:hypothetical protein